jgi:3-deoxy-7-phosphoheptulonate synthase
MTMPFREALSRLENKRVRSTRPLIPPQILQEDLPLCVIISPAETYPQITQMSNFYSTLNAAQTVLEGRLTTEKILHGADDRLLVVVGYVYRHPKYIMNR